jgi:hypothetical protein
MDKRSVETGHFQNILRMKRRHEYEDKCEHSGNETSEGESDVESGDDLSYIRKSDQESGDEDFQHREVKETAFKKPKAQGNAQEAKMALAALRQKQISRAEAKPDALTKKPKLSSNKVIAESSIPPKPVVQLMKKPARRTEFRMVFTNGEMLQNFLEPVAKAVTEMRFNLTITPEFTGFRMETHDSYMFIANKSRYECDVEADDEQNPSGLTFCVSANCFMEAMSAACMKDTVLSISKYTDTPDRLFFESVTNEDDVQSGYSCDLLAESRLESLKGMQFNFGYHINLSLRLLKKLIMKAKRNGAQFMEFVLSQSEDPTDSSIIHSKLYVGFQGLRVSGGHNFWQKAKRTKKQVGDDEITEWETLPSLTTSERDDIEPLMKKMTAYEYDNSKLLLFLGSMVRFLSYLMFPMFYVTPFFLLFPFPL